MAPEGHVYTPDPYQVPPGYLNPGPAHTSVPKQRPSSGGDRWSGTTVEQPRQYEPRSMTGRPGSARPPQSPLTAMHSSASTRDDFVMCEPAGRLEPGAEQSSSRSRAHRERPHTVNQPSPMSAVDAGRYAPSYLPQQPDHPPTAGAPYQDTYSARRADIGPPPLSAHSVGSQAMLLPPAAARSRPHSPLRYDHVNAPPMHAHEATPYRSSRNGVEELSPQMASTSTSARHSNIYQYSPQQGQHERTSKPRERHGSVQSSASGLPPAGYARYERQERREPYGTTLMNSASRVADSYGKVDDWRSQQRQHQHQQSRYQGVADLPPSAHPSTSERHDRHDRHDRHERHRRMESSQSGEAVPPLTLPPLSSAVSDRGHGSHGHAHHRDRDRAHGHGHGHTNSLSRSVPGTAPALYTPSLGRSSRDVTPATTPGGSKGSANRMGLGHLMD